MKRPRRFLVRMFLFLAVVTGVGGLLFSPLETAFLTNAPLNGLILGVFALGVIYNFRQVLMLYPEVTWLEGFRGNQGGKVGRSPAASSGGKPPRLLMPMATMLRDHADGFSLSTMSMRSLLDGIYSRLDESRDLSRYTIGLLIFLGLLGTFWGLLETVDSIRGVIGGLSVGSGDITTIFKTLKMGLQSPLAGMGTAFSSSLFGLSGSLILGFLDLQAGQAQNRFYNDLEEWLSGLTRISSGALSTDGDQSVPAYVQALLEQTAESLEKLQRTLARGEESRIAANSKFSEMSEKIGSLTDHMKTEQALMLKLAESQSDLKSILARLAESASRPGDVGMDDATRTHIRNLDLYMARLLEELGSGRDDIIQQLRSEIKLLARTIAAVDGGTGGRGGKDGR